MLVGKVNPSVGGRDTGGGETRNLLADKILNVYRQIDTRARTHTHTHTPRAAGREREGKQVLVGEISLAPVVQ